MNEHEPNPFEWLVYGGTEPTRTIGRTPDPWLTRGSYGAHLGRKMGPFTDRRARRRPTRSGIAYNAAIARNDSAEAARWHGPRIEALLDRTKAESPFDSPE